MKNLRNTNVNEDDLKRIFSNLEEVEKRFEKNAFDLLKIDERMYSMDFLTVAVTNRACSLIDGFVQLGKNNNYIAAVPLIRLQLDNSLRFFAASLVDSCDDFWSRCLKGEHIRNIKDSTGEKMNDSYLIRKMEQDVWPGIQNLYENASGHVHFSNVHAFANTKKVDLPNRTLTMGIGNHDCYTIDRKVDFAYNMFVVSEGTLKFLEQWTEEKKSLI